MVILAAALLLALAAMAGCDDERGSGPGSRPGPTVTRPSPEGQPRVTRLGFSSLAPASSTEAYIGAFATAARYADLVLIQRRPPWSDFLPGGSVSKETTSATLLETALLKQYDDLELFFAIDPTDAAVRRARVGGLPPGVDPAAGFKDPALRESFVAYTTYVVANYSPQYLALGVEINMLYSRDRAQFEAFASLYREAYRAAKQARPSTRVFPTFQLEDLQGLAGDLHAPQWAVIDEFRDVMDALAVSTYPYIAFDTASKIPEDYFAQLSRHFDGEILIAETAYTSAPAEPYTNVGTEEDQAAYLERLASEADRGRFSMVVWLAALDPAFVRQSGPRVLADTGLRHADGANKLAWGTWETWARRPLRR